MQDELLLELKVINYQLSALRFRFISIPKDLDYYYKKAKEELNENRLEKL